MYKYALNLLLLALSLLHAALSHKYITNHNVFVPEGESTVFYIKLDATEVNAISTASIVLRNVGS